MKKTFLFILTIFLGSSLFDAQAQETLLLRNPDISANHITFAYGSDIWIANKDGSNPIRLTNNQGEELNPHFSPDGKKIAFTGNYDGNTDVYVIQISGGNPVRVTQHPASDMIRGWLDNNTVYFTSTREYTYSLGARLHKKALNGTRSETLPMPEVNQGSISPDGNKWAYIKNVDPSERQRVAFKGYRGGGMPTIWIFDNKSHEIEEIPGLNSNNVQPLWRGSFIYFLSDRTNRMNLYRYNTQTKQTEQLSFYTDYDIKNFSGNDKELIFEQAGTLHLYDIATKTIKNISVRLESDVVASRPYYADMSKSVSNYELSPTGVRALFESRGEIFSVPVDKGIVRNLSNTPGAYDRYPAWSPDGKWVSFISDKNGKFELVLIDSKGENEAQFISLGDTYFYFEPKWSPDSKKIIYGDSHLNLFYIDIATKKITKVDSNNLGTNTGRTGNSFDPDWSADSKWITYTKTLANQVPAVFIYEVSTKKTTQITDGMSNASNPVFSADGNYLFFSASTNIGLSYHGLHMTSYGVKPTETVYAFLLSEQTKSPLLAQSDEENVKEDKSANQKEKKTSGKDDKKPEETTVAVKIDLGATISSRIIALPIPEGNFYQLNGSVKGQLLYSDGGTLHSFDFKKQKSEELGSRIFGFKISADGKKIIYPAKGGYYVEDAGRKLNTKPDNEVKLNGIKLHIDPTAEWAKVFSEVWNLEKEYFYVENMHGADWPAIRKKYEPMVPFIKHRADLSYLLNDMMGEMIVGHNYIYPGTQPEEPSVSTGVLGVDYKVVNNFYQIEKIYSAYNWNPKLKSPLSEPGVGIKEGDYLLKVNGKTLDMNTNVYDLFAFTVNKEISLTVNSKPDLKGAKEIIVKPISFSQELSLRKNDWVERNRARVKKLSNDQIAYIYMENTGMQGYTSFNRDYFSQMDKKAVLIDERNNGGGSVADYVVDLLSRELISFWKIRDGKSFSTPGNGIYGPKAMIINEYAGSGGDMMPYMFRIKGLGKLVGRTTMGILVGISGYPPLLDGGRITSPNFGIYDTKGNWIIENEGVAPDIFVEQTPKELLSGKDPQLEKTVQILLEEMKTYPYINIPVPKDPVRVKN